MKSQRKKAVTVRMNANMVTNPTQPLPPPNGCLPTMAQINAIKLSTWNISSNI